LRLTDPSILAAASFPPYFLKTRRAPVQSAWRQATVAFLLAFFFTPTSGAHPRLADQGEGRASFLPHRSCVALPCRRVRLRSPLNKHRPPTPNCPSPFYRLVPLVPLFHFWRPTFTGLPLPLTSPPSRSKGGLCPGLQFMISVRWRFWFLFLASHCRYGPGLPFPE